MSKIADSFRNPVTRARAYIWLGLSIVIFGVSFFGIVATTSSYWFCTEVCHSAHDDNTLAYQLSTHNKVGCLSCHMPAGGDPVTFMLHKAHALKEVYTLALKLNDIPLNKGSRLSMNSDKFPSTQCTQCHNLDNRKVTPSAGIMIDHDAHKSENISCTMCHNRIAHNEGEGYTPVNHDPQTGELNVGHPNFMTMTGCARCHRLEDDGIAAETPLEAPGTCETCHPASFDLVPASHKVSDWKGMHGEAAVEAADKVTEAKKELEGEGEEGKAPKSDEAKATAEVPNIGLVNECYTCHAKTFCTDCHGGVEMPHATNFGTTHGKAATENQAACITCHGTESCNSCHHNDPNVPGWTFDSRTPWRQQHGKAAESIQDARTCYTCHEDPTYCERCHIASRD